MWDKSLGAEERSNWQKNLTDDNIHLSSLALGCRHRRNQLHGVLRSAHSLFPSPAPVPGASSRKPPGRAVVPQADLQQKQAAFAVMMAFPISWTASTTSSFKAGFTLVGSYPSGVGRLYAEDLIVKIVSCPRIFWTPICPTGGIHDEVEHEPNRNQRCE